MKILQLMLILLNFKAINLNFLNYERIKSN
jgi:hypothetical protein